MAESFLFGIAETLLGKLGSLAVQQIAEVVGATKELDKLHKTLKTIQAVRLDADADQQLHRQMNNQLKDWLQRLKDACLDAEDVLDDFELAALQQQLIQKKRRNVRKKVCHFFSSSNPIIFRYRMSHKIKEIREELDAIAADRDKFHTTTPNQNRESNRIVPEWRDTHSSASDIIGRGDDIEHLVNVLMQMDSADGNSNSVDVVTIVGIGGLGKTALAKSLYNDRRVEDHFQLQKWVCVGEIFETKTIIGKIVDKDLNNMEQSVKALKETLSGKRYLLVLDDVWNEEVEKWNALMELFMCGNKGSKIVVTTRSQSIAKFTTTTYYTHTLGGLLEEDSVSLLLEQALGKGQEDRFPDLVEIGKDIVKKCKGVPLAIRTLGGVLYMKTDKKEWCWVRDDKLWNLEQKESGILPALELSFIHLPSYLKPCFSFCSLFVAYYLRTLEIRHCYRLKSLPPTLRNLRRLETLAIASCEDLDMTRMMTDNEQLTESMGGPDGSGDGLTSLRYLSIIDIPKLVNIPNWLLQDLQHCLSLQHMQIEFCRNMTSLLGGPYRLPSTLQKLTINDCRSLERRCARDTGEDWQYIFHVPNIIINKVRI